MNWLSSAIANGTIFPSPQRHAGSAEAAAQLIKRNIYLAPEELLPDPDDVEVFTAFFNTFLTSTFDVVEKPGVRGEGPIQGCDCPVCVRIVQAPYLQPKKLYAQDKRRADKLMVEYLSIFAIEAGLNPSDELLREIVNSASFRRDAALLTYCHWLILRMSGKCDGPAVLALWRLTSRSPKGGMIKGFVLTKKEYDEAACRMLSKLRAVAT